MKTLSKTCLCLATLSLIVSGCTPDQNRSATITIKSVTQPNAAVTVSLVKNLDKISLAESTTDSAGRSSFEIALHKPTIALIQIGEKYGEVFLAPGYDLVIVENGQDYKIPLTFSGEGADVNNYISWVNSNVEKIKRASEKGLYELDVNEFRHRFDSLKTTINNFHEDYLDSVALPRDIVATLEYKNATKFSAVQQEFKFYKLNDLINMKWEAHKEGREYLSDEVAIELGKLADEMSFDSVLMVSSYADYDLLLNFYWRNNVYLPVAGELIGSTNSEKRLPQLTAARIRQADCADAVRESLSAFNVKFWLGVYGITSETDSIFSNFKERYRRSGYLASLDKTYGEFLALAPGKPAPELAGLTPKGKFISIKDLRGKIVYIDIWASWCAPCVAEIPASIELQKKLSKEDGIQFLNVSVDSRRSDWEKFLDKNANWTGTQIIIEPEEIDSLYKAYKLSGIPAYILLDQHGNIIDLKAPRPSDEKLEMEIMKRLAAK